MIRILLIEDHAVVREGLTRFLERTVDLRIVAEAANGALGLTQVLAQHWDLVMLDIALPDQNGIAVLRQIRRERPLQSVLMFSGFADESFVVDCLNAGAGGYLIKDSTPDEIRSAIRTVAGGGRYISPILADKTEAAMLARIQRPHERLTEREFDVLLRISRGQSLTAIGNELNLSVKTISSHRTNILGKLGCASNTDLARYVLTERLDNPRPGR